MRNKAYPKETLCNKGKNSNLRKACKNSSVVNGHRANKSILCRLSKLHRRNILRNGATKALTVGSYYSFLFFSLQVTKISCYKNSFSQIVIEGKEKETSIANRFSTVENY